MKSKKANRSSSEQSPVETPAAEALTVGWMLSVSTCVICLLASFGTGLLLRSNPEAIALEMAAAALFFAALVISVVMLLLTPLVYKVRRVPPPRSVTIFVVVVALLPWIMLLVGAIR